MILDIRVFGYLVGVPDSTEWFLAAGERGNFATSIPDCLLYTSDAADEVRRV